jgi:hypothetical protein
MRHYVPGEEEYLALDDHKKTNDELLTVLNEEYQDALEKHNHTKIEDQIAPRFWSRFAPYFSEYEALWQGGEHTGRSGKEVDGFMFSREDLGKIQAEWMDQVLRGEIELGDEMNEETSEY